MRIISGKFKGKRLNFLKNNSTRPLKDSVKENIFNILTHSNEIHTKIENANVLDLYSGIGSFGLECISRGVKNVTFVEKDKSALNILEENLIKLTVKNQSLIINDEIESSFNKIANKIYNIFFLDPPFKNIDFMQNLELIKKNKIYANDHVVIIHRERNSNDNF